MANFHDMLPGTRGEEGDRLDDDDDDDDGDHAIHSLDLTRSPHSYEDHAAHSNSIMGYLKEQRYRNSLDAGHKIEMHRVQSCPQLRGRKHTATV